MKIYEYHLDPEQSLDPAYIEASIQKFRAAGWEYVSFVQRRNTCDLQFRWPENSKPAYPEGCEPVVDETPAPAPEGEKKSFFKRLFR